MMTGLRCFLVSQICNDSSLILPILSCKFDLFERSTEILHQISAVSLPAQMQELSKFTAQT